MLETLDGARTKGAKRRAGVRFEDLGGLLNMATALKSTTVAAAPTAAQHNALRADLVMIHTALRAVQDAVNAKLRP